MIGITVFSETMNTIFLTKTFLGKKKGFSDTWWCRLITSLNQPITWFDDAIAKQMSHVPTMLKSDRLVFWKMLPGLDNVVPDFF